jgi:hypothetical protein
MAYRHHRFGHAADATDSERETIKPHAESFAFHRVQDPNVFLHLKQISARTVNPPVFCVSQAD